MIMAAYKYEAMDGGDLKKIIESSPEAQLKDNIFKEMKDRVWNVYAEIEKDKNKY